MLQSACRLHLVHRNEICFIFLNTEIHEYVAVCLQTTIIDQNDVYVAFCLQTTFNVNQNDVHVSK